MREDTLKASTITSVFFLCFKLSSLKTCEATSWNATQMKSESDSRLASLQYSARSWTRHNNNELWTTQMHFTIQITRQLDRLQPQWLVHCGSGMSTLVNSWMSKHSRMPKWLGTVNWESVHRCGAQTVTYRLPSLMRLTDVRPIQTKASLIMLISKLKQFKIKYSNIMLTSDVRQDISWKCPIY